MTTIAERALAIRLATIKTNTEIHDALLADAIEFALRPDAIALFEDDVLAQAKDSRYQQACGKFYVNLDPIAALGPFTLFDGKWAVDFPFRPLLLDVNTTEFYRSHPLVIMAISRLRTICGSDSVIDRPYVVKNGDNYSLVFGVHIRLPQRL